MCHDMPMSSNHVSIYKTLEQDFIDRIDAPNVPLLGMRSLDIFMLPQAELQEKFTDLQTLKRLVDMTMERALEALNGRFLRRSYEARRPTGKLFGVNHILVGPLAVTVDIPKEVHWDQARLAKMAKRIRAAGERPEEYMTIHYAIDEARYKSWPKHLRAQFARARTELPGTPAYRLAYLGSKKETGTVEFDGEQEDSDQEDSEGGQHDLER